MIIILVVKFYQHLKIARTVLQSFRFIIFLFIWQATEIRHPSGCAEIVFIHGRGLGWFGTFLIM